MIAIFRFSLLLSVVIIINIYSNGAKGVCVCFFADDLQLCRSLQLRRYAYVRFLYSCYYSDQVTIIGVANAVMNLNFSGNPAGSPSALIL